MKSLKQIVGLFFSLYIGFGGACGQNLIADPGFEIWDGTSGQGGSTLSGLTHWYNANGTADHHHVDIENGSNLTGLEPCPTGEGNTWCGFPHEGGGVLGCWKGNGPDGTKEWAGTQLLEPLIPGECYEISFWIQNKKDNPNSLYETNQWGVFFSGTEYPTFNANLANFSTMSDHWAATDTVIGGSEWQQVQFAYTASEAFEYFYIGYMGDVSTSTYTAANDDYMLGFYVWIDEVVVQHVGLEVPDAITLCRGDSTLLHFESDYAINWTDGIISDTTTSVWVKPQETTTYYVEARGDMGCTKLDSVVVTMLEEIVFDYPEAVCVASTPFLLDANANAGQWHGPGIVDTNTGRFDPAISGSGAFAIEYVSATDCSENYTLFIEVEETPDINIVSDVQEGCLPLTVVFNDISATAGLDYEWSFGDGNSSNDLRTTSHTFNEPGVYDLNVRVKHFENCTSNLTVPAAVQAYEAPRAAFEYSPDNPDILENEVSFMDNSIGTIVQWQWDFGDHRTSSLPHPTHEYLAPGNYEVQLQVTGLGNCIDSTSQTLTVNNAVRMYVPNAFSPNDDGINDHFELGYVGELFDYKMTVFNRWGGLVFQSTNPDDPWDGKAPNGQPAELGVYTYFIEYTILPETATGREQRELVSGDVMILR